MRRARLPAFAMLVAAFVPAAFAQDLDADRADGWIGYVVPPYPSGVVDREGSCVGEALASLCSHSVAVVKDEQNRQRLLLFLESMPTFGKSPMWRVLDAREPDELLEADVYIAYGPCRRGGDEEPRVVALVGPDDVEWRPVRRAWRYDLTAGRLQALSPEGLACLNEGFGYDG